MAGFLHPYDNLKREKLKQKISQSSKEIIKELIQDIKSLENDEEKLKSAYKVLKAIIKD